MNKIKQNKRLNLVKKIFKLLPSIDTFINDTSSKDHRSSKIEKRASVNCQSSKVHQNHVFRHTVVSVHKAAKSATETFQESKEQEVKESREKEVKESREREEKKSRGVVKESRGVIKESREREVNEFGKVEVKESRELQRKKANELVPKQSDELVVKKVKELNIKEDMELNVKAAKELEIDKTKESDINEDKEKKLKNTKECEVKADRGRKVTETEEKVMRIVETEQIISVQNSKTKETGQHENISAIAKDNYMCIMRKDESQSGPMTLLQGSHDCLSAKQQLLDHSLKICPSSKTVVINSYDFRVPAPGIRYSVPSNINRDTLDLQQQSQIHPMLECGTESISAIDQEETFSFNFPTIRQPKIFKMASHLIINSVKKAFLGDNQERKPFSCVKYEQMIVKDSNNNEATIFQYYKPSTRKKDMNFESLFFLSFLQTFDNHIPDIPYSTTTFRTIISFKKASDSFSCVTNLNETPTYTMGLPLCISTDLSLLHWSSFSYQSQSPEGSFTNKCVEDDDSFFLLLNKDEMAPIDILCKALQSTVPHILSEEKTNSYINDVELLQFCYFAQSRLLKE